MRPSCAPRWTPVVSIDADGRILEFNPAAQRMFGYEREAAIGAEMADLIIPPALRDAHRAGLRRLREGGENRVLHHRIELEAQRADGSTFPIELAITRIPGAQAAYTGFVYDITTTSSSSARAERAERQALVVALAR